MTYEKHTALLAKAEELISSSNYNEAELLLNEVLMYLDSLEAVAGGDEIDQELYSKYITLRVGAQTSLATIAGRRGDLTEALNQTYRALNLAEVHDLREIKASCWNVIGLVNLNLGDYDKAVEHLELALAMYQKLGRKSSAALVMRNIGVLYRNLGTYDKALEYSLQARSIHQELGLKSEVARGTLNIGIMYQSLGSYDKALEYFAQALASLQELNEKSDIAIVTGNIGIVYQALGSYDKALEYMSQALATHQELGEKSPVASVTVGIGNLYFELTDYPNALEYQKRALALAHDIGDRRMMGFVQVSIGNTLSAMGNMPEALEFLREALQLRRNELQTNEGVANTLIAMGILLGELDYGDEALEKLREGLVLAEELGEKAEACSAHREIAWLLKKKGETASSYSHFEKFHDIDKEVQSEVATQQAQQLEHRRKAEESERDRQVKLARFQEQEKILHNILPSQIADRMIDGEKTIADSYEHVSVFFSDIVGFTKLSQRVSAEELVGMLNGIFTQFDQLARKHGLEKIKTIGDAYMAVCGAPIPVDNHAERTALFALDVAELMNNYQTNTGDKVMIRIGLHSGSVVAGIIGENKFAYDMWGDAVNTASRMESHGEAGKIHVSEEFKHAVETLHATSLHAETLHATSLQFIPRGEMDIKGKGMMRTYFLERI